MKKIVVLILFAFSISFVNAQKSEEITRLEKLNLKPIESVMDEQKGIIGNETRALSAQEYGKLLYSENVCSNPSESEAQNISFKLENEILHITGRIIANCCGNHFMKYEIYSDSIFLLRVDEGELCDCYCLYDINIEIRNCPSNSYKIKLDEYSGNDGIDTTIYLSQSSLNKLEGDEIKFYPNPTTNQLIIELPNYKFDRFILYDIFGKTVKSIDIINDNILFVNIEDLLSGTYIFRLLKTNGITLSRKIIIK